MRRGFVVVRVRVVAARLGRRIGGWHVIVAWSGRFVPRAGPPPRRVVDGTVVMILGSIVCVELVDCIVFSSLSCSVL